MCDRILIMNDGKIITLGTMAEIQKEFGHTSYRVEFMVDDVGGFNAADIEDADGHYVVSTDDIDVVNVATKWVASRGGDIIEMRTIEPTLEDIFLELMGFESGKRVYSGE